ncbi:MAG: pyrroloquinoline quinone-dependent dehydrogenase [Gemmatimonadaceae bacterium]
MLLGALFLTACGGGGDEADKKEEGAAGEGPAAAPAGPPQFTQVTDQMLLDAGKDGINWLMYGGSYNNQRYSRLEQINKDNVKDLQLVYVYQTGITKSFETTPLVVNGIMYMTTPDSKVITLNAVTGEEMWRYEPKLGTTIICCGPNNRGVALYQDKVFVATLDDRLIALNQKDGSVAWEVQIDDPAAGYSQTMAPLIADGKVIIGTSGAEYGIRGYMKAFNPADGKLIWTWYAIPAPGEAPNGWWGEWKETDPFGTPLNRNIAQEKADSAKYADSWRRGGGSMWMTPAYDPATKTLIAGIGNPSPDLDGKIRPGDNLYTESIVAVSATDGKLKWYFQTVPHDVWDLDAVSPPVLFERNGRRLVGHAGKTAWYYVLETETGKAVLRSEDFTPRENMFAQPTKAGVRMLPGANGGSEWSPTAYSPKTGFAYVLGLHQPMNYSTTSVGYRKGQLWLGSAFRAIPGEDQWGTFSAINVDDGKIAWQRKVADPMIGGALATAGNLVFVGQANGNFDAFDAEDGDVLWRFYAGAGVNSAPMTFSVGGTQYVAVAAGGNAQIGSKLGDDLYVFALRERASRAMQQYETPGYPRGSVNRMGAASGGGPQKMADTTRKQP